MDYKHLEDSLRAQVEAIAHDGREWSAEEVAHRLTVIADQLAAIRQKQQEGIDASMGKRSGWKVDI